MNKTPARVISLRFKLTILVATVLAVASLITVLLLLARLDDTTTQSARRRAEDIGRIMGAGVQTAVRFSDEEKVRNHLDLLDPVQGALFAYMTTGGDNPIRAQWRKPGNSTQEDMPEFALSGPELELPTRDRVLHVVVRWEFDGLLSGKTQAVLVVGFSMEDLAKQRSKNVFLAIVLSGLTILIGAAIAWGIGNVLVRPITELTAVTTAVVANGDLSQSVNVQTNDEVSALADSFRQMMDALRAVLTRAQTTIERVSEVSQRLTKTGEAVTVGAHSISDRLNQSQQAIDLADQMMDELSQKVDALNADALETSSTIIEMATANQHVAQNVDKMASSVEETSVEIEQFSRSIVEIANMLGKVDSEIRITSSSMSEIHGSIREVERSAVRTAEFAVATADKAAAGVEAIGKTNAGIEAIRSSAEFASTVIHALGQKAADIGRIISVINDVAEQTNLLALNAAIIAAQAGEHGRGFSVVADEIKVLAQRTRASTGEIGAVIRGVQQESENAVAAMNEGMERVAEGTALAADTGKALSEIVESSQVAKDMVQNIAVLTKRQAQGANQANEALERVSLTIAQVARASNEQALGAKHVAQSTETIRALTGQVRTSTQEQNRGSQHAIEAIERIADIAKVVDAGQQRQASASHGVTETIGAIRVVAAGQMQSVSSLEVALGSLGEEAKNLQRVLQRFKVKK